jgi:hypothetical protein
MASSQSRTRKRRQSKASGWRAWLTTDRIVIVGAVGLTLIFLLVVILNGAASQPPAVNLAAVSDNSTEYEIQSRDHIDIGSAHPAYNSNPPTGGWHYASPANVGFYTSQLQDEQLVHNLEHGQIWISYRDADDQETIDVLRAVQATQPGAVIVTYRPEDPARIAVASWGRLLLLDTPDTDQIYAYIARYKNHSPEPLAS